MRRTLLASLAATAALALAAPVAGAQEEEPPPPATCPPVPTCVNQAFDTAVAAVQLGQAVATEAIKDGQFVTAEAFYLAEYNQQYATWIVCAATVNDCCRRPTARCR